jgi:hypothetical protein
MKRRTFNDPLGWSVTIEPPEYQIEQVLFRSARLRDLNNSFRIQPVSKTFVDVH